MPPPLAHELHEPDPAAAAARPDALPVVLTHGFGGTLRMWDPTWPALVAAGHRVLTWDLPGHGRSDWGPDRAAYTLDAVLDAWAALLDRSGIERACIGGLSLGGQLALGFRNRFPERVAALVLADTGPGFRDPDARAKWNRGVEFRAQLIEAKGFGALGKEAGVGLDRHLDPQGLVLAARGYLEQRDSAMIDSLDVIDVPTLVLVGSEDRHFLAATDYLARKIRNARKVVVDGAGHVANIDRPEAFNAALVGFLETT